MPEVQYVAGLVNQGVVQLAAEDRPTARLEESPVAFLCNGQSEHRGGQFVRTSGNDPGAFKLRVGHQLGMEHAQFGAGGDDRREKILRQAKPRQQALGPGLGRGVVKLRGAGEREFGTRHAG